LSWIAESIGSWVDSGRRTIAVGIALPGIVSRKDGVLLRSVNLPWLENREICAAVEGATGVRAALLTDAEAATWGEYVAAGRPEEPFAHLRLGTGVACGVIIDGKLIPTDPDRRTHLPVLVVDRSSTAPKCRCGLSGCLEMFASGLVLIGQALPVGITTGLAGLNQACRSGERCALAIIEQAAEAVGRALSNLRAEHRVERVVLGGGVVDSLPILLERIGLVVQNSVTVEASRLGDNAGIIGAATFPDL
jgi:predicted NBD/HSP70 family sugar kinase